jgi:hypothetical protein
MKGIEAICMLAMLSLVMDARGFAAEEQSPLYLTVVEISDGRKEAWRSTLNNVENLQNNLVTGTDGHRTGSA